MQAVTAPGLRLAGSRAGAAVAAQAAPPLPAPAHPQQHPAAASSRRGLLRRHQLGSSPGSLLHTRNLPCRQTRVQVRAAAAAAGDAAGGADGQSSPVQQQQQQPQRRPRDLSLQQRWRATKFAVKEAGQKLSHVPPIAAVLAALAALNAQLQPLRDGWAWYKRKEEEVTESYNAFVAEETRRQWAWSKRFSKELEWWGRVPPFMGFFAATLVYQAFMPVSLAVCVVLPLYYSWVLWDSWWLSPIFLATLAAAPLKWLPYADKCLIWPGLI